jgi:hypothetical protein
MTGLAPQISPVIGWVISVIVTPLIIFVSQRALARRLDAFDQRREDARTEREEREERDREQREAEHSLVLAIARTMLLDNYEKCMRKGYYTVEEREVYGKLFIAYEGDGGNGVIGSVAPRMRELPMEPPRRIG